MSTIKINLDIPLIAEIKEQCLLLNLTLTQYVTQAIKYKLQELQNDGQI